MLRSLADIERLWQVDRRFKPKLARAKADAQYAGWQKAVTRVRA